MKQIGLLLAVFLLSLGTGLAETGTLKGKVTDASNQEAIPFAYLKLMQNGVLVAGTSSDVNGGYTFKEVKPGKYDIETSYIGYEKHRVNGIDVKAGKITLLDIKLKSSTALIEEVQVVEDQVRVLESESADMVYCAPASNISKSVFIHGVAPSYHKKGEDIYYQQDFNTESYDIINENKFLDVVLNPLSTFSVDVDKASYANLRRYLNNNQKPPVDAVRIEEMINYFDYDYPQPKDEHPFSINMELGNCPWNSEHELLMIGLQGKEMSTEEIPATNLVFLIDVSGSMNSPNKLPLLKQSFKILVDKLRPEDRVAIVVYAGAAGLVLNSTTGRNKTRIIEALDKLQAGGSTAGGAGIQLAYGVAKENFIEGGNNRVILATDGDFNIGESSDAAMERLIEDKRDDGIFLTVLGFGMGNYKDSKMEKISNAGNGNYAYIDNILEAKKMFGFELWGTLFTIAKDVKFQIEFNPSEVKAYRLIGYENRMLNKEDFNDDKKDAGEIGSGHRVTAFYEIIPANSEEVVASVDPLEYQAPVSKVRSENMMTVKLRFKKPDEDTSRLIKQPVKAKQIRKGEASENFMFASAVASFGMLLRDSEYKGTLTYEGVERMARHSKGKDVNGYRSEFIKLVETAALLK